MSKELHQITDHRGNAITPTRDQLYLYQRGWRIVDIRKRGMMKQITWQPPDASPGVPYYSQGQAVWTQRRVDAARLRQASDKRP